MFKSAKLSTLLCLVLIFLGHLAPSQAALVEYDLTIAWQEVNFTGKPAMAMTVNGAIPGPVLRFREGDLARIRVRNDMEVETSIHWHGILVPPGMDGVPFISFPPIAPGQVFTYEFPIRQSGTYWYHSHTGMQEQRGVYGAIVIEPPEPRFPTKDSHADRDYVVLLSDWADEDPHSIMRTLKRGSEWYALEKGSAQSIFGAARLGMLGDYFKRELQRMSAMDIADVAYDRFLANGKPEIRLDAKPGETVRLRIINGSATTYFHLEFAGGPMRIVSTDGQDVEPLEQRRLLVGVAETYDILVKIPEKGAYELRATAHDGSGFATVWLGDGDAHPAPDVPKPNLYHSMGDLGLGKIFALTPADAEGMGDAAVEAGMFDEPGMPAMNSMKGMESMGSMKSMESMAGMGHAMGQDGAKMEMPVDHAGHDMKNGGNGMGQMEPKMPKQKKKPAQEKKMEAHAVQGGKRYGSVFQPLAADVSSSGSLAMDGMDPSRPWPPYEDLRSAKSTALADGKPIRKIRLTLDGDMERYVWFLNNKALSESDDIAIREGEIVQFIMTNRTMMHHPMHLHGHFFRVINGQGDYSPLKHTVDVAPMSTTVIEFDANEVGDWFFHCHLLYHMDSGMARVVHYENFIPPQSVAAIRPALYDDPWYLWGEAEVASNMTEGFLNAANTRHTLMGEWEAGWQKVDKTDWEGIFSWGYYINRFFTVFAGLDILGEGSQRDNVRGVLGITYLLPLNIESRYWLDTDAGGRFMFEKEFVLTPRLTLIGEAEYDTHKTEWEGKTALTYRAMRSFSLTGQWHSDFGWGAGCVVYF